jgi:hypothetical protein
VRYSGEAVGGPCCGRRFDADVPTAIVPVLHDPFNQAVAGIPDYLAEDPFSAPPYQEGVYRWDGSRWLWQGER